MASSPSFSDLVFALACVIAAIFALRLLLTATPLRRSRGQGRRLRLRESCALGPRQRLHVVEVDGQRLLVAASESRIELLRELADAPAGAADAPQRATVNTPQRGAGELDELERRAAAPTWRRLGRALGWSALVVGALGPAPLALGAEPAGSGLPGLLDLANAAEPERLSSTLEIVALLTVVSLAPSILLMATCFTRVVIVLSLLRQAVGIQQLPPNQVLVGLALFVTLSVMAPVGHRIHSEALQPYISRELDATLAMERGLAPAREFLMTHTRERDVELFLELSGRTAANASEVPMSALLPSYMLSELRTAFQIGFMIFLPFLVIDLVVASVLISMGMIVLPPIVISLPFKLMLFVLLDGWNLVISSLLKGLT